MKKEILTITVEHYKTQRVVLGILGMALPFLVLVFGALGSRPDQWWYSISATYYSPAMAIFVGLMYAVGLLLITYDGYDRMDRIVNRLAGLFGIILASFPCYVDFAPDKVGLIPIPLVLSNIIHLIAAAGFFILLAYNCLFLFTKGNIKDDRKMLRNGIYVFCGLGIVFFMLALVIASITGITSKTPTVFFMEFFMLQFFGAAWIVKSQALPIFKDLESI